MAEHKHAYIAERANPVTNKIIPTIGIVPCSVYQNSGTNMYFNIFVESKNKLRYYLTKYIHTLRCLMWRTCLCEVKLYAIWLTLRSFYNIGDCNGWREFFGIGSVPVGCGRDPGMAQHWLGKSCFQGLKGVSSLNRATAPMLICPPCSLWTWAINWNKLVYYLIWICHLKVW